MGYSRKRFSPPLGFNHTGSYTSYHPESVFDHLDFALRREGLHLELLRRILPRLSPEKITAHIQATPLGVNARRLWYLYEQFVGKPLDIADLRTANHVPLADPELYYTGPVQRLSRWRINYNLLHTIHFSPMLRRTIVLTAWENAKLQERCESLMDAVPPGLFQRALHYLYAKETRTSYAIERETPTQQRAERLMILLARAGEEGFLEKEALVALQNDIVDARYAERDWRTIQNYVGQTSLPGREIVHLVPPRPEDLPGLMDAWSGLSQRLTAANSAVPPIIAAAVVSWLFVYLHPFEDGNGRIHRFLIHHVLARRQFGPPGVLLPVSAVMLAREPDYAASLEVFSRPLMARSEYTLDGQGRMTVTNDTHDLFRYVDCTAMAEALFSFLSETIEKELPAELAFLQSYDRARAAMRDVVDLPEITANLFLRLCRQNGGRISKAKRKVPAIALLTDAEIAGLEEVIATAYEGSLPESEVTPEPTNGKP